MALIRGLIILFLVAAIGVTIEKHSDFFSKLASSTVGSLSSDFSAASTTLHSTVATSSFVSDLATDLRNNVIAPLPLVVKKAVGASTNPNPSSLTVEGIIKLTNGQRINVGNVPALSESSKLDAAATLKLNDLFAKQYFDHISPTGVGPSDLANKVGYDYIVIGENLALGGFDNDEAVVTAWMNSPHHRENILNNRYQEIGVAVGKGNYQGEEVWIAVQEFGKPLSSCPAPSASLKNQVDQLTAEVDALNTKLNQEKNDVNAYNADVPIYNDKVAQLKQTIDAYNTTVRAFNSCAGLQ
ncbi:MAG: CAP domain-containing protein [Candidatus Pacebacteria bacterium]|nr:CAP domain-containing protein [Candidatus Paceibacterota bacterium]